MMSRLARTLGRLLGGLRDRLFSRRDSTAISNELRAALDGIERLRVAVGRIENRLSAGQSPNDTAAIEFQVFSQSGEDGWIQFLLRNVPVERPVFVEFGVQDYRESNTRFLLEEGLWRGLVIDRSPAAVASIRSQDIYWRRRLTALCAFVTRENIDELILGAGFSGDTGLLSIDIDGNDYWVWESLTVIRPRIVVCEYNALFGSAAAVAVPYTPSFDIGVAHNSRLYFGASVAALAHLGRSKGYILVGCNRFGSNAFFVREDVRGRLEAIAPPEAYRKAQFKQARNPEGLLEDLSLEAARKLVSSLPLVDVNTGRRMTVGDLPLA